MAEGNITFGQRYFVTSTVVLDYATLACQMGFWLPIDPEAAPKPLDAECKNIFSTMVAAAVNVATWKGATINLAVYPATDEGQWTLDGGVGTGTLNVYPQKLDLTDILTGQAVNGGYPSCVM